MTVETLPGPVQATTPAPGSGPTGRGDGRGRGRRILAAAGPQVIAAVIALAVWELLSITSDGWVPGLSKIAEAVVTVATTDTLVSDVATTMRRVLLVWAGAVVVGVAVGAAAGFSWRLRAFLRPILAIAMAIPDLVYIIMAILVLGTAEHAGIIALILAISPLVVNVVMASVIDRDRRLDEMASVYRIGGLTYAREVLWWQLRPAVQAGVRTAFAFSWKLIVLLEAITSPDGVGAQIGYAFKFLRPAEMIVWALLFTVLMKAIEILVVQRLLTDRGERRSLDG